MSNYETDTLCPECHACKLIASDLSYPEGYVYDCPECGTRWKELPEATDELE